MMKRALQKGLVSVISMAVIVLIAGCEEQNLAGTKKCRLLAAENIQLKKQLDERDKEIESQKEQLEKYQQGEKALEEATFQVNPEFVEFIAEENARLQSENEALTKELKELQNK